MLLATTVPPLMVVPPWKVFAPESVKVLAELLETEPAPEMMPVEVP